MHNEWFLSNENELGAEFYGRYSVLRIPGTDRKGNFVVGEPLTSAWM